MILHFINILLIISCAVYAKVTVNKVEECDRNADYAITFTHKIKNENGIQIVEEGGMSLQVDLDDNIQAVVSVFRLQDEEWKLLISTEETVCQFITKYLFGMQEEFEKAAGLSETCPYPKGKYKVANVPLDFEKANYSMVPRGRMRVEVSLHDVKTDEVLGCETIELTVED